MCLLSFLRWPEEGSAGIRAEQSHGHSSAGCCHGSGARSHHLPTAGERGGQLSHPAPIDFTLHTRILQLLYLHSMLHSHIYHSHLYHKSYTSYTHNAPRTFITCPTQSNSCSFLVPVLYSASWAKGGDYVIYGGGEEEAFSSTANPATRLQKTTQK